MNIENSEPHRFKLDLTGKRNLENPKKYGFSQFKYLLHLEKTLNQNTTITNLKFLLQLGMKLLIYLMVLILLMIFKIILNLSMKNIKHELKIHWFKFIQIKSKTDLFSK